MNGCEHLPEYKRLTVLMDGVSSRQNTKSGPTGDHWQIADHPVTMAIDRIDRHEDGKQWRVWDYKTSGKAKQPDKAHFRTWCEAENRPQLGDLAGTARTQLGWAEVQLPMYAAFTQQRFDTGELATSRLY